MSHQQNEILSAGFLRLLNLPTTKWSKKDWEAAAIIIAKENSENFLIRGGGKAKNEAFPWRKDLIRKIQLKIEAHSREEEKSPVGRPKTHSLEDAKNLIAEIEKRKKAVSKRDGIPLSKITDKAIALEIAKEILNGSGSKSNLKGLQTQIIQQIKYARLQISQDKN